MRYNLAFKSKSNSGSKGYTTFYSSITDPWDDAVLGVFLEALDLEYLANNAKVQTSAVIDDVFDDEIELPDPAHMEDEKDVIFYLGNKDNPEVFFVITFGHIKKSADVITPFTRVVEADTLQDWTPFETRDGQPLNKVIRVVERNYQVIRNQ